MRYAMLPEDRANAAAGSAGQVLFEQAIRFLMPVI
jgi:hypothetical protein